VNFVLDINAIDQFDAMLDAAEIELGHIDLALIAHGTLPDQAACDASVETTLSEIATNGTSTIALCSVLSRHLRAPSTLAVISSVAGDRGRASNYVYGSAKAAVGTYLSGLRQRLDRCGINVLTIKPGFVDTPMTAAFRKGFLWVQPDTIARGIERAVSRRRGIVYLPGFWWGIMCIIKHIPEFVFRKLKL
jgi:NAD(P)-dependent dehydrogenase (short-subunit alcohol dehydrogenase family)